MKRLVSIAIIILVTISLKATTHIVHVWEGYYQFVSAADWQTNITIQLGDTVQWRPLPNEQQSMTHTVTSTSIPTGAEAFDYLYQVPADTFFQYVPQFSGLYNYECTPHVTLGMIGSITVEGPNSINEVISSGIEIVVYPNPVTEYLQLKNIDINSRYNIYSYNSELILIGQVEEQIDISILVSGAYFIEIVGDIPHVQRFIKQ